MPRATVVQTAQPCRALPSNPVSGAFAEPTVAAPPGFMPGYRGAVGRGKAGMQKMQLDNSIAVSPHHAFMAHHLGVQFVPCHKTARL
jgi:hypothetical protein